MKRKKNEQVAHPASHLAMRLEHVVLRPDALDILRRPSRIGQSLFYPDGRVVSEVVSAAKGTV